MQDGRRSPLPVRYAPLDSAILALQWQPGEAGSGPLSMTTVPSPPAANKKRVAMSRSALTTLLLSCVLLLLSQPLRADDLPYRFGLGKADITGEAAEVGMMGYSSLEQKTAGIHMRQWARAFVIEEPASGRRLVYVNTDLGMIFQAVHLKVLERLKAKYPGVYDENNVMLAATHTHSGPGGFSHYAMYNLSVLGFQEKTFNAIVDGIVRSIERAQASLQPGRLFYGSGELRNASRNRSLLSHLKNPDIAGYEDGIDPQMSVLSFVDANGELAGAISWFPVHSTSMTNANHLISPDNKGYASYHWEHDVSRKSGFVAAFAQTNAGNLSPNLNLKPGSVPSTTSSTTPRDRSAPIRQGLRDRRPGPGGSARRTGFALPFRRLHPPADPPGVHRRPAAPTVHRGHRHQPGRR